MQKKKGVSLIALVITIIVMIILAAAIMLSLINSGIINLSVEARDEVEKETITYLIAEAKLQTFDTVTEESLTTTLENEFGKDKVIVKVWEDKAITILLKESNKEYYVDENKKVNINVINSTNSIDTTPGLLAGKGTEESPYLIESIEDLVYFQEKVNATAYYQTAYSNQYIALTRDLDFRSFNSYVDYDKIVDEENNITIMEKLTTGKGFVPISHQFSGTLDGNGHTLYNLYINRNGTVGLFGDSTYYQRVRTIKNLNITGNITGTSNVGSVIGSASVNTQIINCNNYANVTGDNTVGGVSGSGAKIETCNNYGRITGASSNVGGIAGVGMNIINCNNYGEVIGKIYVGGVCGNLNAGSILECANFENVAGDTHIGGVAGLLGNGGILQRNYNKATVNGKTYVGGVTGWCYRDSYIKCAYNTGDVTGQNAVGGVIGSREHVYGTTPISSNCYNIGTITGDKNVGQVIGFMAAEKIENMYYNSFIGNKGIGNRADAVGVIEGKDEAYLKSQKFVDLLNASHTHTVNNKQVDYTNNCWKMDTEGINDGYPIFK